MVRKGLLLVVAVALTGCADPGPGDVRGYVKPPLETPGLIVRGEEPSAMADYGEPIAPRVREPDEVVPADAEG